MKWIRVTMAIIALLMVIGVLAIGALAFFINPNKLKPVIAAEVKKQTGYEVVVDGHFSWSFYPRIGIKVEHIALLVPKQIVPFVDLHNVTFVTEFTQLLRGNQRLRGDIYIAEVNLLNVHARNAHVGLRWQNQVLILQPITAALYDGSLEGVAQGYGLSSLPSWDWDMQLSNIQLHPLLQDVNGADSHLKLSGIGHIKLHVMAQGKTRETILNSLNGTSEFSLKNGVLEGVDLNYLVKSADAMINKQPPSIPGDISQTLFDSLMGTAVIKSGVMVTNDLSLMTPALVASGAGSINLVFQAINLQLRITPQKDTKTQWVIPVMVTGNLYRPDVRLDATELNIMVAKEKLDKVREKIRQEASEHFSGKTGEFLQDLLRK